MGHVSYFSYPQSLFSFSPSALMTVHSKLRLYSLNSAASKLRIVCVVLVWFSEVTGKRQDVGVEDNSFEVVFFLTCSLWIILVCSFVVLQCLFGGCLKFNVSVSCHRQQGAGKAVLVFSNDAEVLPILDFMCSIQHLGYVKSEASNMMVLSPC